MNTVKINAGKTKMIAHRGVSGLEKENTTLAFVAAGNRSYYGVESDVHRTADGKFILIHDNHTRRVSEEDYTVEETDFDRLRSVCLSDIDGTTGRPDLRLPTPQEYIRICKKYEKVCVLELKNHMTEEDVRALADIFVQEDYLDRTVFISFDYDSLVYMRQLLPEQKIQFLCKSLTDDLPQRLLAHRFDVDIEQSALTKEGLELLHRNGIEVNCWTVNDPARAEELASWGVDYITSNILEAKQAE